MGARTQSHFKHGAIIVRAGHETVNAKEIEIETASALKTVKESIFTFGAYVGLDVHKDSIAVSVATAGRTAPESRGEIANCPALP